MEGADGVVVVVVVLGDVVVVGDWKETFQKSIRDGIINDDLLNS